MSETLDKATEDKAKPETEADAGADRDDEDELDDKMSLVEHLAELRTRLFYSVIALVVCFFACFYFASEIFNFLVAPLAHLWEGQEQRRLIYTALHEALQLETCGEQSATTLRGHAAMPVRPWRER